MRARRRTHACRTARRRALSAAADIVSYVVCLLLAPSHIVMIACTPSRERSSAFTRAALGLAAMYAVLCASVYYLQLSVLRLRHPPDGDG